MRAPFTRVGRRGKRRLFPLLPRRRGSTSFAFFLRRLHEEWRRNKLADAAAALTFYAVLALFPFLLFLVSIAGLVLEPDQVRTLIRALGQEVPPALLELPSAQISELTSGPSPGLLTFSGLAAVFSATTGVVSLIDALNSANGVSESRPFWKVYGIALGTMILATFLALLAGFVAVALPSVTSALGSGWAVLLNWLRLPVAAFLMMVLWAALYSVLPDAGHRFKLLTWGSVAGVLVWLAASLGFSFYLAHFSHFGVTYGALGAIVVLLLWMWISSLALMLGAGINSIRSGRSTQRPASPPSVRSGAAVPARASSSPAESDGAPPPAAAPP